VSKDSRLVLVNALYFKGPWEQPFSEHATKPAPFHVDPRKSPLVTTMHATGYYHYAERDDVRLLRLPYRGNDLLMTVVLPRERLGLPELWSVASTVRVLEALALRRGRHEVGLPRAATLHGSTGRVGRPNQDAS
jgi:serine protease inhibitor